MTHKKYNNVKENKVENKPKIRYKKNYEVIQVSHNEDSSILYMGQIYKKDYEQNEITYFSCFNSNIKKIKCSFKIRLIEGRYEIIKPHNKSCINSIKTQDNSKKYAEVTDEIASIISSNKLITPEEIIDQLQKKHDPEGLPSLNYLRKIINKNKSYNTSFSIFKLEEIIITEEKGNFLKSYSSKY